MINPDNLAALQALLGDAGSKLFVMDFSFLGINLANIPKWNFWTAGFSWASIGLFLLPWCRWASPCCPCRSALRPTR